MRKDLLNSIRRTEKSRYQRKHKDHSRRRSARRTRARGLCVENLEQRALMTGDIYASVTDIGLLNDTGDASNDRVTANWTLAGHVDGQFEGYRAFVEFDLDGDQVSDGEEAIDVASPVFAFDARQEHDELRAYEGPVAVHYRAVVRDETGQAIAHSRWETFSFTATRPPEAPWHIEGFGLARDTGDSATDRITWDATLVGVVTRRESSDDQSGENGSTPANGDANGQPRDTSDGSYGGSGSGSTGGTYGDSAGGSGGGSPSDYSGGYSGGSTESGTDSNSGTTSDAGTSGNTSDDGSNHNGGYMPDGAPPSPLSRAAVEWDLDGDGRVDARRWLQGDERFRFLPDLPAYGHQQVAARVMVWDDTYGVPLYSSWQTVAFVLEARPAADVVDLHLAHDTGPSDSDRRTADPTVMGRIQYSVLPQSEQDESAASGDVITSDASSVADVDIYVDWDADGTADDLVMTDAEGRFSFRPRGFAPGEHKVQVRASRWDRVARADVFGDWTTFEFEYVPELPPSVRQLEYVADAGDVSGGGTIVGALAESRDGIWVELDLNSDGQPDAYAMSDGGGRFAFARSGVAAGRVEVGVRTTTWDTWDQVDRTTPWTTYTLDVPAATPPTVALTSLGLYRDTGERSDDRVTSDGTLVARLTTSNPNSLMWVELDVNQDGVTDEMWPVDADQRVVIPRPDWIWGDYRLAVRGAAWDAITNVAMYTTWQSLDITLAADPLVPPQVAELELYADTGSSSTDRRTTISWVRGRVEDSATSSSRGTGNGEGSRPMAPADVFIEFDENGDGAADQVLPVDPDGQFFVEPTLHSLGTHEVRARAVRWITATDEPLRGDWTSLAFVLEAQPDAPATISRIQARGEHTAADEPDGAWNASEVGKVPVTQLVGQILNEGRLDGVWVEFDIDGDGLADASAVTDRRGTFHAALAWSGTGTQTIRARTVERHLTESVDPLASDSGLVEGNGSDLVGPWQSFDIEWPAQDSSGFAASDGVSFEYVRALNLAHDNGQSDSDYATSDPSLAGRIASFVRGDVTDGEADSTSTASESLGNRRIAFDWNGDGEPDGFATTREDGTFTIEPNGLAQGRITVSAWIVGQPLVDATATSRTLMFVLAEDPDGAEAQALSRDVALYEEAHQAAVDAYHQTLNEADAARRRQIREAAARHNEQVSQETNASSERIQAANQGFYAALGKIEQEYAETIRAAATTFQTWWSQQAPDSSFEILPEFVWADMPDVGAIALPDENLYVPPETANDADPGALRPLFLARQQVYLRFAVGASADESLIAHRAVDMRRNDQIADANRQSQDAVARAVRRYSRELRRLDDALDEALRTPHPNIDLDEEAMAFQAAVQWENNRYEAARRFHAGQLFTAIAALTVKLQDDVNQANWTYDKEMQDLADYYAENPPSSADSYQDMERAWRRRAFYDRETSIAEAYKRFEEGRAGAERDRDRKDAAARAKRDNAIRLAEHHLLEKQLDVRAWRESETISAWERYWTGRAQTEQDRDLALAEASRTLSLDVAAITYSARQALASITRAQGERTSDHLSAIAGRIAERTQSAFAILESQWTANAADYQAQSAQFMSGLEQQVADIDLVFAQNHAAAVFDHEFALAQARLARDGTTAVYEVDRLRDLWNAAHDEETQKLAGRLQYYQAVVSATLDRELERADAKYDHGLDLAKANFDHRLEVRDIRLAYGESSGSEPIEVFLAAAEKRCGQAAARADHRWERAQIDIDERWSDRQLAEHLQFELFVNGFAHQRAMRVAAADRTWAIGNADAAAEFDRQIELAESRYRVAESDASQMRARGEAAVEKRRAVESTRLEAARERADAGAWWNFATTTARDAAAAVQQWAAGPGIPQPWSTLHTTRANARRDFALALADDEQAWTQTWTAAWEQQVSAQADLAYTVMSEQADAYAVMVRAAADSRVAWADDVAAAARAAGTDTAGATHQFLVDVLAADRTLADTTSHADHVHDEAIRDAFFDFQRAHSDARLALRLEQITQGEFEDEIVAARRAQRTQEASAYVAYVQATASAEEAATSAYAMARLRQAEDVADAAERQTVAQVTARGRDAADALSAWQQMRIQWDQISAWYDGQMAVVQSTWHQTLAAGNAAHHDLTGSAQSAFERASELSSAQFRVDTLQILANARESAWQAMRDPTSGDGGRAEPALQYRWEVARREAIRATEVRDATEQFEDRQFAATRDLVRSLNQADADWALARSSADEEFATRLAAATKQYGQDTRVAIVDFLREQVLSEGRVDREMARHQATMTKDIAQADAAFIVDVAAADTRFAVATAQAAATLYIEGQSPAASETADESLTDEQRAYLAAVEAARQAFRIDVRGALVQRAAKVGDAWIQLQASSGATAQAHATTMGQADVKLAVRWDAASMAHAIQVTDASKHHVEQIAMADTVRDDQYSQAHAFWTAAVGDARVALVQRKGQADVTFARETARAETRFRIDQIAPTTTASVMYADWLQRIAPAYVQYREDRAVADANYQEEMADAIRKRDDAIATANVTFTLDSGDARVVHATSIADSYATYHIDALTTNHHLIEGMTQADADRKIEYASALADHDVAVARAGKQLLIHEAWAYPSSVSAASEHDYAVAVAAADRDFELAQADAEQRYDARTIPLESRHALETAQHLAQLDKAIGKAEWQLRASLAAVYEDRVNGEAQAAGQFAMDHTDAVTHWRWRTALAEAAWQDRRNAAAAQVLTDYAARHPTGYAKYRSDRATAEWTWWNQWQNDYVQWVSDRNRIERNFTYDVVQAYRTMTSAVASADTTHVVAWATADNQRRDSDADARIHYAQRLENPAALMERELSDARRDYREALANAKFQWVADGSLDAYHAAVAEAERMLAARTQVARDTFRIEEGKARTALDTEIERNQIDHAHRYVAADAQWQDQVNQTLRRWDADFVSKSSARAAAVAQLDNDYAQRQSQSRELAFAQWESEHGDAWSEYGATQARASVQRAREQASVAQLLAQQVQPAREQLALATRGATRQFADDLRAAETAWSDVHAAAWDDLVAQHDAATSRWIESGGDAAADSWMPIESAISAMLPGGSLGLGLWQLGQQSIWGWADLLSQAPWFVERPLGSATGQENVVQLAAGQTDVQLPLATPPDRQALLPQLRQRPGMEAERAELMERGRMFEPHEESPASPGRSAFQWFLDDLGLMAEYPAAALGGAIEGSATSFKVGVNGSATTLRSYVTLGIVDSPWELLSVNENDRANGYDAAFSIFRVSSEFLVGAGTGRLANPKVPSADPWVRTVGNWAFRFDVGQNAVSLARGGYGVAFGDGWTFTNTVNLLGGVAGLSGNALRGLRHTDEIIPHYADEVLDHRIGFAVTVSGPKDVVGHAFAILEAPNMPRKMVGFYPKGKFRSEDPIFWFRFFLGGNTFGLPAEVRNESRLFQRLTRKNAWMRIVMFDVSARQYQHADQFVEATTKATEDLTLRYHVFSQCAVFTRKTLEAGGVRPFVAWAYPPYMYLRMWLRDVL